MNTSAARQWDFEDDTAPDAPVLRLVPGRNRIDDKVYEDTVLVDVDHEPAVPFLDHLLPP